MLVFFNPLIWLSKHAYEKKYQQKVASAITIYLYLSKTFCKVFVTFFKILNEYAWFLPIILFLIEKILKNDKRKILDDNITKTSNRMKEFRFNPLAKYKFNPFDQCLQAITEWFLQWYVKTSLA